MDFFSKRYAYPVCGMYSAGHILFLLVIALFIAVGLFFSKNISEKGLKKQTLSFAIVLWVLEIIKIGYNHLNGYFGWDQWVPLAFCSLMLYALWFAILKNPMLHKMGSAWIIVGGTLGGLCYLIYPSTSLTEVQALHFLAFHGMGYHGVLLYLGILYFIHSDFEVTLKNFKYYAYFLGVFFPLTIILDYAFKVNLMFFREAYNLPKFVAAVAEWNLPIYTLIVILFYSVLPYAIICGVNKLSDAFHKETGEDKLEEMSANQE